MRMRDVEAEGKFTNAARRKREAATVIDCSVSCSHLHFHSLTVGDVPLALLITHHHFSARITFIRACILLRCHALTIAVLLPWESGDVRLSLSRLATRFSHRALSLSLLSDLPAPNSNVGPQTSSHIQACAACLTT